MIDKALHIVCLNVPYPMNIGANYDLFYKLEALQKIGIRIHLHCFIKNNESEQPTLANYCATVHYYKRIRKLSLTLPYNVSSRDNKTLKENLLRDDHPILVESTHCTAIVMDKRFANRKILLRAHNVEYLYYLSLLQSSNFGYKKIYYWLESLLLKRYEKKLAALIPIITLTQSNADYFVAQCAIAKVHYVPLFYKGVINMPDGIGNFCLYHGNLSVAENENAVVWLLENVFNNINIPFVIAGRNPSKKLIALSHQNIYTCIAANPSEQEMYDLVQKAQINVLPSINTNGIKLKLLNSLYYGRFCITNIKGANGFDEKDLFTFADDANTLKNSIKKLYQQPFTEQLKKERAALLLQNYNLDRSANKLASIIWSF